LTECLSLQGKVIFCVNLDSNSYSKQLINNITAIRFATKLRETIIKKQFKQTNLDLEFMT